MQFLNMSLLTLGIVATLYTFWLYTSGNKGWFKSEIGQLLLSLSGAVLLFELWYLFLAIFPDTSPLARTWIRLGLFIILTATLLFRAFIMTKLRLVAKKGG